MAPSLFSAIFKLDRGTELVGSDEKILGGLGI